MHPVLVHRRCQPHRSTAIPRIRPRSHVTRFSSTLLQVGIETLGTLRLRLGCDERDGGMACCSVLHRLRGFRLLTFADLGYAINDVVLYRA